MTLHMKNERTTAAAEAGPRRSAIGHMKMNRSSDVNRWLLRFTWPPHVLSFLVLAHLLLLLLVCLLLKLAHRVRVVSVLDLLVNRR